MMAWDRLLPLGRHGDAARVRPSEFASGRPGEAPVTPDRTPFQRDYDRIVFSSAFRRLHDKTQVFPLPENDLVHSRLTHSLEVACVGRSLGTIVGQMVVARGDVPSWCSARDFGDVVAAACLAHDIGNPPFGHSGEDAIGGWFSGRGAQALSGLSPSEQHDLAQFEGNAQGFRIVTRLQMPTQPGLKLTYATLAAFTKYPRGSAPRRARGERPVAGLKKHGYHSAEAAFFAEVAGAVGLLPRPDTLGGGDTIAAWSRHPLAFLVEAADDICYAILDLEDGVRLGHVSFELAQACLRPLAPRARDFPASGDPKEHVGYLRALAINTLIQEVCAAFAAHEREILAGALDRPLVKLAPSYPHLEATVRETRARCYEAKEVLEVELAGYEVLEFLLDELVGAALAPTLTPRQEKLLKLLPHDPRRPDRSTYERLLIITDYLSGMTDGYAVTLFRRFKGMALPVWSTR